MMDLWVVLVLVIKAGFWGVGREGVDGSEGVDGDVAFGLGVVVFFGLGVVVLDVGIRPLLDDLMLEDGVWLG